MRTRSTKSGTLSISTRVSESYAKMKVVCHYGPLSKLRSNTSDPGASSELIKSQRITSRRALRLYQCGNRIGVAYFNIIFNVDFFVLNEDAVVCN